MSIDHKITCLFFIIYFVSSFVLQNVKTRALHVSRWCKLSKQRAMLCMEQTDIDDFVEAVCKLSWQMVWQQPPMTFTTEGVGQPANEDLQKVLPGRDTVWPFMGRQVVERYLEPTLKQGEDILEKGTVIIGQKIKCKYTNLKSRNQQLIQIIEYTSIIYRKNSFKVLHNVLYYITICTYEYNKAM